MFTTIANSVNSLVYATAGFALKAAVVIPLVVYVISSAYSSIYSRYYNQLEEARYTISAQDKQIKLLLSKQKELDEKFSKMLLANSLMANSIKDQNLVLQEHQKLHTVTTTTIKKNKEETDAMCEQLQKDIYIVEKCAMEEVENLQREMDEVYNYVDDTANNDDLQYQITELYDYVDTATANIHTRIDETNNTIAVLEKDVYSIAHDTDKHIEDLYDYVDTAKANLNTRIDETNNTITIMEKNTYHRGVLQKLRSSLASMFSRTDKFEDSIVEYIDEKNETTLNYVDAKVKTLREDLITFFTSTEHKINNMNERFEEYAYASETNSLRLEDLTTRFGYMELSQNEDMSTVSSE